MFAKVITFLYLNNIQHCWFLDSEGVIFYNSGSNNSIVIMKNSFSACFDDIISKTLYKCSIMSVIGWKMCNCRYSGAFYKRGSVLCNSKQKRKSLMGFMFFQSCNKLFLVFTCSKRKKEKLANERLFIAVIMWYQVVPRTSFADVLQNVS